MRLSKAPRKVFPHKDVDALGRSSREARAEGGPDGCPYRLILVVTDGVFSMDGDIAPLPAIVEVAEEFEAAVFVDDAHASGVLGRNGRGTVDHFGLHGRVAIQVGTLSQGGRRARRLRRRLAGPARHPHPARAAVPLLDLPPAGGRRGLPRGDRRPRGGARAASNGSGRTPHGSRPSSPRSASTPGVSETPITPVMMGDSATAGRFSDRLLEEGVFAQPVVFPTVALDKARIRTIVTAAHTRRDARHRARRVRPGRPRARPHRRVTEPVGQARDLPLDSHLHTDQSPDSDVPIDVYAALALERGIAELAITDHVDFDPRDPAYEYATFADRERTVRQAAERWAERGVTIRFGAELTYNTSWEDDVREHVARHRYDFTIGSVHDWPGSPYAPGAVAAWAQGHSLDEIVTPYFEQVAAAARSGLFDTIGHLDVVKRYLNPHVRPADLAARPDLLEPALRALVESGTSPRDEHERPPPPRARDVSHGRDRRAVPGDGRAGRDGRLGRAPGGRVRVRPGRGLPDPRPGRVRGADVPPRRLAGRDRPAAAVPAMTDGPAGLELFVVGAGPAYTDRPGAVGAAYLVSHGSTTHPARPRPGRVHEPRGADRAEHAHRRGDLAPASRSLRGPRAPAALPAL